MEFKEFETKLRNELRINFLISLKNRFVSAFKKKWGYLLEVFVGAFIAILLILPIFFTPYICKPFANEPNGVQTPPAFTAIAEWWNE